MQLLGQASKLSKQAQVYQSEGNYQYARRCYEKISQILTGIIKITPSSEKCNLLKQKLIKYRNKVTQVAKKEQQKSIKIKGPVKVSKFGFPVKPKIQDVFGMQQYRQNQIQKQKKNNIPKEKNQTFQANKNKVQIFKPKGKPNVNIQKQQNKFHNLKGVDPQIQKLIIQSDISFKDIVGMHQVKKILQQAVIRPKKRPDLYSGIRAPPKGLLLYGPPGNGKTYICKALANQSGCVFIALSASAIMNKLVGQSQKMLRKVFQTALMLSPCIIFIDQIDSILTNRSQNQNQASRRLKTEFLVLLDGISSPKNGQILLIGATNLPKQLDIAAKRRFNKLIYIGMPNIQARQEIIAKNLKQVEHDVSNSKIKKIAQKLQGYSASQITDIVKEVCMTPLRDIKTSELDLITKSKIRKVNYDDFVTVIQDRKPLLSKQDLKKYSEKM